MTRKDYELIAKVLRDFTGDQGDVIDRDRLAYVLAEALFLDNPRFDRLRFLVASDVMEAPMKTVSKVLAKGSN